MPLPAALLLQPDCAFKPGWAVLDPVWYLRKYGNSVPNGVERTPSGLLTYYLQSGAAAGHAPSPFFDEIYYLQANPDIAALVRAKNYVSGFDHYCQLGHRFLAGHWLFDDALYDRLYDDMSLENLDAKRFHGRYDHYLRAGQHENRQPHLLFDKRFYRAQAIAAGEAAADIDRFGPFTHFLYRLQTDATELPASIYFDPNWVLQHVRSPAIGERCGCSIAYYLRDASSSPAKAGDPRLASPVTPNSALIPTVIKNDRWYKSLSLARGRPANPARIPTGVNDESSFTPVGIIYPRIGGRSPNHSDPVPEFSEQYYLQSNPDVRAMLNTGAFQSGYQHFLQIGVFEFRRPSPDIDLLFYRDANPEVRDALNTGATRDAFAHLREIGLKLGLPTAPEQHCKTGEAEARQLFIRKARDNLPIFARRKIDFTPGDTCRLSVIMVTAEKFDLTMQALSALRRNFAGAMQLILVENGSSDATADIEHYVVGARIIREAQNTGYVNACNLALGQVNSELALFLHNDVELGFGAIDAAIARLYSDSRIGAVGGKIIRAHGRLQEAGCIIWRDGGVEGYMRDAPALAPEANFVREVDFCSGVFLLCRTEIVKALGGFDPDFSPACYEDADLCVRMAKSGLRIVYDPAIVTYHLGSDDGQSARTLLRRGQKIFVRKHAAFLQSRPVKSARNLAAARSPSSGQRKILFIEDTIPLRRLGSGYVRANDIVHAIAAGCGVSVFPVNGAAFDALRIHTDLPDSVEILHDRDISQLAEHLQARPGYYDLIWISRTHNLARVLQAGIDPYCVPILLDTEAVVSLREHARMALAGATNLDFDRMLRDELALAPLCRQCIAVSEQEADLLRKLGLPRVAVVGTMREADPASNSFEARSALLFIGSIHSADSPNLDALFWYLQAILPALLHEMETPPILNFAGYVAPGIDLSPFAHHPHIKLHASSLSLAGHYEQNRLFIAPTRFAAGTPYKIYETASFGLPCVATELLASQVGWADGEELLTAPVGDAKRFAAQIARLYSSKRIWTRLRNNALARIRREHSPAAFDASVAAILKSVFAEAAQNAASSAAHNATAGNTVPV